MRLTLFSLILLLLAGCSGNVYARAYTASGEGANETELAPDEQFNTTEDLNVVVKLNRRKENVQVVARFIDPNEEVLEEITANAAKDVGTVVLGVDYQGRSDQINQWLRGRYRVEILIDDTQVDTLFFRID